MFELKDLFGHLSEKDCGVRISLVIYLKRIVALGHIPVIVKRVLICSKGGLKLNTVFKLY